VLVRKDHVLTCCRANDRGKIGQEQGHDVHVHQQLLPSTSQKNARGVPPAIRDRAGLVTPVQQQDTDLNERPEAQGYVSGHKPPARGHMGREGVGPAVNQEERTQTAWCPRGAAAVQEAPGHAPVCAQKRVRIQTGDRGPAEKRTTSSQRW